MPSVVPDSPARRRRSLRAAGAALLLATPALLGGLPAHAAGESASAVIQLSVDLTDAPRKRFQVHESLPVKPGPLRLVYPKWIPGEHGPTGPINGITGIHFSAAGKALAWRRDPREMYALLVDVPAGTDVLDLEFQYLPAGDGGFGAGGSTTPDLAELEWNQVVYYPEGAAASAIPVQAAVKVPSGWQYATALEVAEPRTDGALFKAGSLERLVDSPLFAGRHVRSLDLSAAGSPSVHLHIFGDKPADLEMKPEQQTHARNLVVQMQRLTGTAHYRHYDFLLGLSDHTATFGLEHHESSDDRLAADYFNDPDAYLSGAILLPHEYFHSWNGKFRRPRGLATPDYQQPMEGGLLWVYEGMTNYYGEVLAARAGQWNAEQFRDNLAMTAAAMQQHRGRSWRPLQDTADAAQLLYGSPRGYSNWRRSVDFYPEGTLLWLDVDTELRTLSKGSKSLDDFVRAFHGTHAGALEVLPYDFEDVVATLDSLVHADWRGKLKTLLERTGAEAPLDGLRRGGWQLVFNAVQSPLHKAEEKSRKFQDQSNDLGLMIGNDPERGQGGVIDVIWGSPAFAAGVAPGMRLVAVNDRDYSAEGLREAIREAARDGTPIRLLLSDAGTYRTLAIDYRGGLRYPHLEAVPGQADLISGISAPLP